MKTLRVFIYAAHENGLIRIHSFQDKDQLTRAASILVGNEHRRFVLDASFEELPLPSVRVVFRDSAYQVLVSESAALLLRSIEVSRTSVAEVEGLCFYALVRGFGFASSGPELEPRDTRREVRGWVAELEKTDADLFEVIRSRGIWDEDSYRLIEPSLAPSSRSRLGNARYRLLTGEEPKAARILDQLRFCPPWFVSRDVHSIALSARQSNVLRANGIAKIGDLARFGTLGLLKLPNLGRKSVNEMANLLYHALLAEPRQHETKNNTIDFRTQGHLDLPSALDDMELATGSNGSIQHNESHVSTELSAKLKHELIRRSLAGIG
jgi:hypothetical protein